MIKIFCVGSRVKYHLLSYWSFVMTSPVEFLTGEFRAKQVNQPGKKRTFRLSKSLLTAEMQCILNTNQSQNQNVFSTF